MSDRTPILGTETPFFLDVGGSARFAVFHPANRPVRGAFLFCHPLFEEKLWAHRAYVSFARRLANSGFSVLRIDLRGTGDSDEDFGAAVVNDYLDDLEAGWEELLRRSGGGGVLGTFGLRLGGAFALALSERIRNVSHQVLWEPVLDPSRYLHELLRSNLTAQMATHGKVLQTRDQLTDMMRQGQPVDVDGYRLTARLFDSIAQLKPAELSVPSESEALILQVSRAQEQPLRAEYMAWREAHPSHVVASVVEEPFWREIKTFYGSAMNLESRSLEWLTQARS